MAAVISPVSVSGGNHLKNCGVFLSVKSGAFVKSHLLPTKTTNNTPFRTYRNLSCRAESNYARTVLFVQRTSMVVMPVKRCGFLSGVSVSSGKCNSYFGGSIMHGGCRSFCNRATSGDSQPSFETPLMESMEKKIKEDLNAESVVVTDAYGDGRHVSIDVISSAFEGQSAVNRQRMVYKAIWAELQDRVHAVDQMTTRTPSEAGSAK